MEKYPRLHLIKNEGNRGKGYSVRNGLLQASGEVVMFTDADLSAPMEEAELLMAAIAAGADVAIGSRWMDKTRQTIHQPLYRRFFGRCFNWVTRTVMQGFRFKDTQCGFKAFRRPGWHKSIFRLQRITERWGFDPEILFIARKLGVIRFAEVPVTWGHDERSRMSYLKDGMKEDAGRDGDHSREFDCGPVRRGHCGVEGYQQDGDSAGGAGEGEPETSGERVAPGFAQMAVIS